MKKRNIVILGGGSAGWLTALFAKTVLPTDNITIIQSDEIGIIGVGEATTPHIVTFLQSIGIDPIDLLRFANGSIKNGIHFENWNGDGKSYFHSFTDTLVDFRIPNLFGTQCHDQYTKQCITKGIDLNESIYQTKLSYENKIDLENTNWALHFDATLFSQYLQKIGIQRGINIINDKVDDVILENGKVKKLTLQNTQTTEVDFLFDCSGFARKIIGNVYNQKWISYSEYLPMKKGIPFWVERTKHLNPYTSAIAMKYGWMWQIPLQNRIGSGYIFDSDYIDEHQALQEAEIYYGQKLEIRKIIPFEAGRYENFWVENCMAVGLSSSFIEPLESTSLWLSVMQLELFRHYLDEIDNQFEESLNKFNEIVTANMDEVLNFVYLHYITKRSDSEFWKNFNSNYKTPPKIERLMNKIKNNKLRIHDIIDSNVTAFFTMDSYLQVCEGLQMIDIYSDFSDYDRLIPPHNEYKLILNRAVNNSQLHNAFLEEIKNRNV